jgi:hypothetical protein
MTTIDDLHAAENNMRELLETNGLSQPDDVEYRETSLVFLWHDTKAAVVIDLTE